MEFSSHAERGTAAGGGSIGTSPSPSLPASEFYRNEINKDVGALRQTLANLSASRGITLDQDIFFQAHAALNIAETLVNRAIK